jgi:hypothetical protein
MVNSFSDIRNAKKIIIKRGKVHKQNGQKKYPLSPLFLEIEDLNGNPKVLIGNEHNKK